MSTVKQVLLKHQNGDSIRSIARHLSISRNTVKSYLAKFETLGVSMDALLALDDMQLESRFHPGNPAYSDLRHDILMDHMNDFCRELKDKGVTRHLLWEEYSMVHHPHYSYSQFCYHLEQNLKARKPTMVLNHNAAEKLMIDFSGHKMSYIDRETGEVISCQLYIATLPFSNYIFVKACLTQGLQDFISCTKKCLEFFGGVPQALVTDNLKSAVTKANKYEPDVNETFQKMANHYGTTVFPTRTYKPQDKAMVELMVRNTYTHIKAKLRKTQFFSLTELNEAIEAKTLEFNQRRRQMNLYTREEQFVASEKPLLKALPSTAFDIEYIRQYKIAQNNHFCLTEDKHYYSVPYIYIGKKVKVIYTGTIVKIYYDRTLIAQHVRDNAFGKYTTSKEHLCSAHQAYLDKSPDYYKHMASKNSTTLHTLISCLFDQKDKYPEQLYKTCDGLFSLGRKYKYSVVFTNACQTAIDQKIYSYVFIKNMLDNNMAGAHAASAENKPLPDHSNIRGKDYFD
ncbi:MAG: IS21 family transposase [Saprospiraceae bacterium]